jgi:hypothetical protein
MILVKEKIKHLGLAIVPSTCTDVGRWQTDLIPKRNYTVKCSEIRKIFFPE